MIKNNLRWSAADAHLKPVLKKNNFKLFKKSLVVKLVLDKNKITEVF